MKVSSSKSISSPGRAEKYPPPPLMMRFLRSNIGSKSSRARSRASPMFVLRKSKNQNPSINNIEEPSSPKVTCMGQVRVRRSKHKQQPSIGGSRRTPKRRRKKRLQQLRCVWITNFTKSTTTTFSKWFLNLSWWCPRRQSSKAAAETRTTKELFQSPPLVEIKENKNYREAKVFATTTTTTTSCSSSSTSPPKNALMLMRCRSAPYRSSSLACRFWGSPLQEEEESKTEEIRNVTEEEDEEEEEEEEASDRESMSMFKDSDPKKAELGFFKEFEHNSNSNSNSIKNSNIVSIEELRKSDSSRPLPPIRLTRCKSEPARIGAKFDPDISYLRKRRLGFT